MTKNYIFLCVLFFSAPKSRYVHLRHELTGLVMSALPLHSIGIPSERTDVVLEKQKSERSKEQLWLMDIEEKRIASAVDGKCLDLSGKYRNRILRLATLF